MTWTSKVGISRKASRKISRKASRKVSRKIGVPSADAERARQASPERTGQKFESFEGKGRKQCLWMQEPMRGSLVCGETGRGGVVCVTLMPLSVSDFETDVLRLCRHEAWLSLSACPPAHT